MRTISKLLALTLVLGLGLSARADFTFYYANGEPIPDNSASGYLDSHTVGSVPGVISSVTVTLNISGGYNGDLYVWLSHGGGLSVLLNRVGLSSTNGVGYGDAGFGLDGLLNQFTLDDQASGDVHFYQAASYTFNGDEQLTGVWQPDGRILDPESAAGSFDTASRANLLNVFDGMDPNGQWTLYVADLSPGGISTIEDWSLQITSVVPEPGVLSLCALGLVVLLVKPLRPMSAKLGSPVSTAQITKK